MWTGLKRLQSGFVDWLVPRAQDEEEHVTSGAHVPGWNGEIVLKFRMKPSVPNR